MYFMASSFWEWSPLRRTANGEMDSLRRLGAGRPVPRLAADHAQVRVCRPTPKLRALSPMTVENRVLRLAAGPGETWLERIARPLASALPGGAYPLRFAIVGVGEREVVVEATLLSPG